MRWRSAEEALKVLRDGAMAEECVDDLEGPDEDEDAAEYEDG
ncbi:hypothetical protein [Streptomyces sp. NPDC019224]